MRYNGTMSELRQRVSDELLPFVRQPAQYIGGEVNASTNDWSAADLRVALAFPDTYAIGTSHLGSAILYHIANHMPGVACERVYSPWADAESVMRSKSIPLFTWETRHPVASADVLGITLQYEMNFTNVLALLDLAGMPLRSADRAASNVPYPLVIAGGSQADNPEPLANFIDLFIIGDGEHSWPAVLQSLQEFKRAGGIEKAGQGRREFLIDLARKYEWAYVPALYSVRYHPDGTIAAVEPNVTGLSPLRRRCVAHDFETLDYPTAPIVPWTRPVHERINLELMRGCPQNCRFCHAGHTRRPIGWRSVDRLIDQAEQAYRATGFDEIALTSLSTSDYPHLGELLAKLDERFTPRHVSISVPSLRVDQQLALIPPALVGVRKSGLTIAAEAARDPMRKRIGKKVTDDDLLAGVRAAYAAGYRSVKLYFMVGFPGETDDDVRGIVELARRVAFERKAVAGQVASVTASVSPLVPKPHTPFQWIGQRDGEYFHQARILLKGLAMRSPVQVKFHKIERSLLEGVFSRGDRRVGRVIELAFQAGARFDGWDECFDYARWQRAFADAGLDPAFYAHRARPIDEILPWDHIESGHSREWLARQAQLAET